MLIGKYSRKQLSYEQICWRELVNIILSHCSHSQVLFWFLTIRQSEDSSCARHNVTGNGWHQPVRQDNLTHHSSLQIRPWSSPYAFPLCMDTTTGLKEIGLELDNYEWDRGCGTRPECFGTNMHRILCVFKNCMHLIMQVVGLQACFFCWFGGI